MKFLLVDDSNAMRKLILRSLKQAGFADGHEFREAENGKVALALAEEWQPDVVLTDWHMPEMDGIELVAALVARGSTARIGLITSERNPQSIAQAREAGATFVLNKPFTPERLREAMAGVAP